MTEYVEKQEDWMAPNGWGQRLSVQGVRYQTVCSRRQDAPELSTAPMAWNVWESAEEPGSRWM